MPTIYLIVAVTATVFLVLAALTLFALSEGPPRHVVLGLYEALAEANETWTQTRLEREVAAVCACSVQYVRDSLSD